ncbi:MULTISPECIES: DUF3039 domain-containing protein [unclassified Cryobacterium]|uniref:DUF3039 domain-containing protein n=1 Tax=unclassified Cryobacterium TaxID=2649013 RepID=UPI001069A799|nr:MULTISPECIES: DUF3039 domain-containing protein [unclassified Cryobacterium]TFB96543.1 DUF3039 domain-containing protein [Cryobacterium sp. MDB2-A-1]TFC12827.1 DUF3039 domain-containing protein [Cryobacterium sp. MDB2-A-2]
MSDVLERTKPVTTDTGDHDTCSHYFEKTDLDKAWIHGNPIEALCGKWDVPMKDPTRYPVCGTCKNIIGRMKP